MRDVQYRTVSHVATYTELRSEQCPVNNYVSTLTLNNVPIHASGRDNVKQGDHVSPTGYKAYRIDITHRPASLTGKRRSNLKCIPTGVFYTPKSVVSGFRSPLDARYYGNFLVNSFATGEVTPRHDDACVADVDNQLLARMASSDFDAGESLADLKSSAELIRDRMESVLQAFNAMKHRNYGLALRSLGLDPRSWSPKSVANGWLELKFGWLPLLSDIWNAAEAILNDFKGNRLRPVKITANSRRTYNTNGTIGNRTCRGETWYETTGYLIYKVRDPQLHALASMNLANPLSILWASRPLSFVLDWLVPVGAYLKALTAPLGLEFMKGGYTHATGSGLTFSSTFLRNQYHMEEGKDPEAHVKTFGFKRITVLSGFPKPDLRMNLRFDSSKALTLLALATQRA